MMSAPLAARRWRQVGVATLVVAMMLAQAKQAVAEDASLECGVPSLAFAVGAELGILMPVGVGARVSLRYDDKPRWEIDAVWEPSNYLQSYSVGGVYHPWDKLFFLGARLRWMQLHPPWSRGFHARTDNQVGLGPEAGIRFPIGTRPRVFPFASVGAIFFPSETRSLPPMYTLNIGAFVDMVANPRQL